MPIEKEDLEEIGKTVAESVATAVREVFNPSPATPATPITPSYSAPVAETEEVVKLRESMTEMRTELDTIKKQSIDSEKQDVVSECRSMYITMRGNDLSSDDLRQYEEKLEKLTPAECKQERDMMKNYTDKLEEESAAERKSSDEDEDDTF